MRRLIVLTLMMLCAFTTQAQGVQQEEKSQMAYERQRIGIDYSIPDFSTKRIDDDIIGEHLADMLKFLKSNYKSGSCNGRLMSIVREQNDFFFPPQIKSLAIRKITKEGDVITIETRVTLSKNDEKINKLDFQFVFEKGVSNNWNVNHLFSYLSTACKDY